MLEEEGDTVSNFTRDGDEESHFFGQKRKGMGSKGINQTTTVEDSFVVKYRGYVKEPLVSPNSSCNYPE